MRYCPTNATSCCITVGFSCCTSAGLWQPSSVWWRPCRFTTPTLDCGCASQSAASLLTKEWVLPHADITFSSVFECLGLFDRVTECVNDCRGQNKKTKVYLVKKELFSLSSGRVTIIKLFWHPSLHRTQPTGQCWIQTGRCPALNSLFFCRRVKQEVSRWIC